MAHGGKRPNAGIKPGFVYPATQEKALQREIARKLITKHLEPMIEAQVAVAKGVDYMLVRHEDGTYVRATDVDAIDEALKRGGDAFRIVTQQPNTPAFNTLMAYALDKPAEHVEVTGADGGPLEVLTVLQSARQRLAKRDG